MGSREKGLAFLFKWMKVYPFSQICLAVEAEELTPRTKLKLLILVTCGNSSALIRTDLCLGVYGVEGCVREVIFGNMENFCPGDASLKGRICHQKAGTHVTLGRLGGRSVRSGRRASQPAGRTSGPARPADGPPDRPGKQTSR